ncbi:unnamed protein product [Ambrosiozyma monospora]|uniref:Unnamed protein product n=1 Tax=Ambrosiozyma monospora TaxID=43982 RepID=A0ACB5T0G2_AMBMO|nr:unnamed protein product [Ambrosiozyma monospora]
MNFGPEGGAPEEPDYSKIPVMERITHKVWKARQNGYQELAKQFETSPSEDAECFRGFLHDPQLLKKIATDNNASAQDAGMVAICRFIEFGGPNAAIRTREAVVPAISEKGVNASRPGTKQKAVDALLCLNWLLPMSRQ